MNRKVIWLIELLMWIIIATSISFLLVFFHSSQDQKKNSYYLFFNDIDGLVTGSPVRLMGMQIGYVQDIKVFDDRVFVAFLVTSNNVKVPENAKATIEFYGLGGSKSLEIYPPEEISKNEGAFILTKEPYRIQHFYDVQNNIAKTIVYMNNSFSKMVQDNKIYQTRQMLKINSKVNEINKYVENISNDTLEQYNKKLKINKQENKNDSGNNGE